MTKREIQYLYKTLTSTHYPPPSPAALPVYTQTCTEAVDPHPPYQDHPEACSVALVHLGPRNGLSTH